MKNDASLSRCFPIQSPPVHRRVPGGPIARTGSPGVRASWWTPPGYYRPVPRETRRNPFILTDNFLHNTGLDDHVRNAMSTFVTLGQALAYDPVAEGRKRGQAMLRQVEENIRREEEFMRAHPIRPHRW